MQRVGYPSHSTLDGLSALMCPGEAGQRWAWWDNAVSHLPQPWWGLLCRFFSISLFEVAL